MGSPNKTQINVGASASGIQGGIMQASADKLRIRCNGTWNGLSLSLNVYKGIQQPSIDSTEYSSAYVFTSDEEISYNIGADEYYNLTASGAGGSTDVDVEITCDLSK